MTRSEVFRLALLVFVVLLGAAGGMHMCNRGSPVVGTEVVALTAISALPWMAPGSPRVMVASGLVLAGFWFPISFAGLVHEPNLIGNPKAVPKTDGAAVPAWHTWFSGIYLVDPGLAVECNHVVNDAQRIEFAETAGSPPRPRGGQIRPGHYQLVSSTLYRTGDDVPLHKAGLIREEEYEATDDELIVWSRGSVIEAFERKP